MKRNLVVAMLIIMVLVIPVSAHSLQWGLAVEDQFEYTAQGYRDDIGFVDVDYSLTITGLEPIPHEFVVLDTWPRAFGKLVSLEDGSTLDMGSDISAHCWAWCYVAVPIDDWYYLSTVIMAYNPTVITIDIGILENSTHWGYTIDTDTVSRRNIKEVHYLKENGILVYHDQYLWSYVDSKVIEDVIIRQVPESTTTTTETTTSDTTTDETTTETTTTGDGTTTDGEADSATPLDIDPLLIIAVVGLGAVCVIVVALSKRKKEPLKVDAKVLIICPYCGSKTEQGITKCQKCGAEL